MLNKLSNVLVAIVMKLPITESTANLFENLRSLCTSTVLVRIDMFATNLKILCHTRELFRSGSPKVTAMAILAY